MHTRRLSILCVFVMGLVALFWARPGNRDDALALVPEDEGKPPAAGRAINIVYTVNNLGYTDTCG